MISYILYITYTVEGEEYCISYTVEGGLYHTYCISYIR